MFFQPPVLPQPVHQYAAAKQANEADGHLFTPARKAAGHGGGCPPACWKARGSERSASLQAASLLIDLRLHPLLIHLADRSASIDSGSADPSEGVRTLGLL